MATVKFLLNLLLLSFLSLPAVSQHYWHTSLWLRLAPSVELNEKWTLTGDVWYRRQNDRNQSELNPLGAPLLNPSGRLGVTYRSKAWTFTAYPLALYHSFPLLGKPADYSRPRSTEFRPQVFLEWTQQLPRQFSLRVRGGYEYRRFMDATTAGRARLRLMLRKELPHQLYTFLWNETLTPARPNVVVRQTYEINRTNLAIGRGINKHLTLEAGYQFSHRQRKSLTEFDEEQALTLTGFFRF